MNASKECDADDEDIDDNVSDNIADDNDDNNYDDGDDQVWVHDHWGGHEDMWRGSVSISPHCQSNYLHHPTPRNALSVGPLVRPFVTFFTPI